MTRSEAKTQGLKFYDTGKPCVNGHSSHRRTNDGSCVPCEKARQAEVSKRYYQSKDHRHFRNIQLKYLFGIGINEYEQMLERQSGVCSICSKPNAQRALCVDHNHTTGQVRELLCDKCNSALGLLNEDTDVLQKMIDYINKHKE